MRGPECRRPGSNRGPLDPQSNGTDSEGLSDTGLTPADSNGCTERCTGGAGERAGAGGSPGDSAADSAGRPGPPTGNVGDSPSGGVDAAAAPAGDFAEALLMLARLPLSDAERTEAVRRLLADHDAKGKP